MATCRVCKGKRTILPDCRECDGQGRVIDDPGNYAKHGWGIVYKRCFHCNATGKQLYEVPCLACSKGVKEPSSNGLFIVFLLGAASIATVWMLGTNHESSSQNAVVQLSPEQLSNQEKAKAQVWQFVSQNLGASFAGEVWNRDSARRDFIKKIVRNGNQYDHCRLKSAADALESIRNDGPVNIDQTEHYVQVMYGRLLARCVRDTGSRENPYLDVLTSDEIARELIQPGVKAINSTR